MNLAISDELAPLHTGSPLDARAFCQGLRDFDPQLFNQTDFKLTDGVDPATKFKVGRCKLEPGLKKAHTVFKS